MKIAIVGPCSSGKSTLRDVLHAAGYADVRNPAQEHSGVPDMWQRLSPPDVLIYLDVDYATTLERRPNQDLGPGRIERQYLRLAHARAHADIYIDTVGRSPKEIGAQALAALQALVD